MCHDPARRATVKNLHAVCRTPLSATMCGWYGLPRCCSPSWWSVCQSRVLSAQGASAPPDSTNGVKPSCCGACTLWSTTKVVVADHSWRRGSNNAWYSTMRPVRSWWLCEACWNARLLRVLSWRKLVSSTIASTLCTLLHNLGVQCQKARSDRIISTKCDARSGSRIRADDPAHC